MEVDMYACKNCGADLHFDIELQLLKCDHCDQTASVYDVVKEQDGKQDEYQLNLFECPQCGGTLLSDDTSITQYCSFCGGMTVLTSRIADEKMPEEIIPFQITKEDCHKAYEKHLKKMFYAPKAFRDCKGEQDFRAIYIPYWKFQEKQNRPIRFSSKHERGRKKLIVTYSAELDAYYDNIIFDASSSFADELGDAIAPFDAQGLKPFTPSYLCGFYADTADVPSDIYRKTAMDKAEEKTYQHMQEKVTEHNPGYKVIKDKQKTFNTKSNEGERIMLPAWFLAYRKGNRVAYATVNGQTGKVEADLPIDLLKFGLASVVGSIILFILLNMFLTLKPEVTLGITSVLLAFIMKLYAGEMRAIFYRDHKLSDMGFAYKYNELFQKWRSEETEIEKSKKEFVETIEAIFDVIGSLASLLIMLNVPVGILIVICILTLLIINTNLAIAAWIAGTVATFFYLFQGYLYIKKTESLKGVGAIFALAAVILSGIIVFVNPVYDLYYYIGIFATLVAVLISTLDLIHSYNIEATQPLPEFMRQRGGEL